ncbi:MAG: polysaccharide deacetylase family protein [Armatimonadota bacterium]
MILLLCLSVFTFVTPAQAEDPLDVIERGLGLLSSGDVEAGRQALAPAIGVESPDPAALSARGTLELLARKPAVAEIAFRRALNENPRHLAALWGLSLSLITRGRVFEATTLVDRAAVVAPNDPRVKTLQAYVYLLLGRYADATLAGKAALEAGDQSPFLLAVLAQVHYNLGYTQKALDFGKRASALYDGMDFLAPAQRLRLPLTMVITDTPQALSPTTGTDVPGTGSELTLDVPRTRAEAETPQQSFQIVAPRAGGTLHGLQRVRAVYRGNREIRFTIFLVDRVMRGMTTELPYIFQWDADSVNPGEHQLTIRAYDYRGVAIEEDTITVTTQDGAILPAPPTSEREAELQGRMIELTLPEPAPLSLFTQMGHWYREKGETAKATVAFEKAAAIDPQAEGVLSALSALYKINGMHLFSDDAEIYEGPSNRKQVALTFDDGPNPLYTVNLLNEMKRYNAHGTFFLVGKMAQQYPDLVLQILAEGHELANHTYTHPNLTKLNQQEIIAEVLRTRTVIKEITGRQTNLFRPPGGNIDMFVKKQLRALDYNIVYWDINAGEYRNYSPSAQAAQIINKVKPGSIILLHNGLVDGTLNILNLLLAELTKQGYTCVTVSELLSTRSTAPKNGNGKPAGALKY